MVQFSSIDVLFLPHMFHSVDMRIECYCSLNLYFIYLLVPVCVVVVEAVQLSLHCTAYYVRKRI